MLKQLTFVTTVVVPFWHSWDTVVAVAIKHPSIRSRHQRQTSKDVIDGRINAKHTLYS